jgi:hypothetical protein
MPTTYEPIATTTLGSAASSITLSSIPATYTDLRLVIVGRENSGSNDPGTNINLTFNGSSASDYSWTRIFGTGSSVSSSSFTAQAYLGIVTVAGGGAGSGVFGLTAIDIFSYAGSTFKTALSNQNIDNNSTGWVFRSVGLWRSTSAITSLTITNSTNQLAAGTTATLYGILKA